MMHILVCLKPVPDPKHWSRLGLDPKTKTLIREGIPNIINPLDRKALEAALQLREKEGGEVITLSMAPIFEQCDLGMVGDFREIIPMLIKAIQSYSS